jgi:hypothetical protein
MILPGNAFVRFAASLRIFAMLLAGAILIAGASTAMTGPRAAASCDSPGNANAAPMNARH